MRAVRLVRAHGGALLVSPVAALLSDWCAGGLRGRSVPREDSSIASVTTSPLQWISISIRFLTAEEGGRSTHVASGYRAQVLRVPAPPGADALECVFDFASSEHTHAQDGTVWLPLGVRADAKFAAFDSARAAATFVDGADFEVVEGRTRVATGHVAGPHGWTVHPTSRRLFRWT